MRFDDRELPRFPAVRQCCFVFFGNFLGFFYGQHCGGKLIVLFILGRSLRHIAICRVCHGKKKEKKFILFIVGSYGAFVFCWCARVRERLPVRNGTEEFLRLMNGKMAIVICNRRSLMQIVCGSAVSSSSTKDAHSTFPSVSFSLWIRKRTVSVSFSLWIQIVSVSSLLWIQIVSVSSLLLLLIVP